MLHVGRPGNCWSMKSVEGQLRTPSGSRTDCLRRPNAKRASSEPSWICLGDSYHSYPLDPSDEDDAAILAAGVHRLAVAIAAGAAACAVAEMQGEAAVFMAPDFAVEAGWMGSCTGRDCVSGMARPGPPNGFAS